MKQIIYYCLICVFFTACWGCDICCEDCGEHGTCNEADYKCSCEAGYATIISGQWCRGFSRNYFIGEWEAKDTLCGNDTCHQVPYTVYFDRHPTDSTLFYAKNLATQVCNNPDSAIWIVSASDGYIETFKHISQTFTTFSVTNHYNYNPYILHFYVVTNGDTLAWKTILRKK